MALPSSGEISFGMLNFEIMSGDGTTTTTGETATSNDQSDNDMVSLAGEFFANANTEGSTSRANLLASPYGMNEFYAYSYNSCVLVGTKILMSDGSVKLVEDLLIDDEVVSVSLSGMTDENYRKYSIEDLSKVKKTASKVKSLIFDFNNRYIEINKNLEATEKHAIFAKKNGKLEWWRIKDLEIGDELVTPDLKLEKITTLEKKYGDFEIVTLSLRDTQTYFANGYLCHR